MSPFARLQPPPWAVYAFLGLLATAGYFALPGGFAQSVAYDIIGASAVLAICVGVWLHRPDRRAPWYLLALGDGLAVAGDLIWTYNENIRGIVTPFPSVADALYLGGYAVFFAGVLLLIRGDRGEHGRAAAIDTAILATGGGVVVWVFLISPQMHNSTEPLFHRLVAGAYPAIDVLILAAAARLAFGLGRRTPALWILLSALLTSFAADIVYAILLARESYASGNPIDAGWLLAYVLHGVVALHPAMRERPAVGTTAAHELSTSRLLLLAAAALTGPALLGFQSLRGAPVDIPVIVGASAILFLLALGRLRFLAVALRGREARFRALVQRSSDIIAVVDPDGTPRYISPSLRYVLGHDQDEGLNQSLQHWLHPDDAARAAREFARLREHPGTPLTFEVRLRDRAGAWRDMEIAGTNMQDEPSVAGIVLNCRDISERKRAEAQLAHQAFHDALTGLPNRALFLDRLGHALDRAARRQAPIAVLFLDLDRFKQVNDTLGHEAGDRLLIAAAERLARSARAGDTVARLGGDEFTVLLESIDDSAEAAATAERIVEAFQRPFLVDGRELTATTSVGVVLGRAGQDTPADLLRYADVALYQAKESGKGRYAVFDTAMSAAALERAALEAELRRALVRQELVLHYQPKVDLVTGRTVGLEALVRWQHPARGLVPPALFIPVAEESGLILPLGLWVLSEACTQLRRWRERYGAEGLVVSVNVSAAQLQQPDFPAVVARTLADAGLPPQAIELEITESVLMIDTAQASATLAALRALGVGLAIDDFGTGYSSLSYLKRFPVDTVKIDRAFIDGLGRDPEDTAIVQAVIELARILGLQVVAEGIESVEHLSKLQDLGCAIGQGYYFARPLDADRTDALVAAIGQTGDGSAQAAPRAALHAAHSA